MGIFLDFVRLTTRAEGPLAAHVRGAKRNQIDRRSRISTPLLLITLPRLVQATQGEVGLKELVMGTHSRSGNQWDIWEAVFSPADPATG